MSRLGEMQNESEIRLELLRLLEFPSLGGEDPPNVLGACHRQGRMRALIWVLTGKDAGQAPDLAKAKELGAIE
jgi:hypothetical protein